MSAFVGLLILNGAPCPQRVVESMLSRLRHRVDARGWSGKQVRCHGSVALGYAPLLSTPESLWELERPNEAQTLTHNGLSLWITSDVRLDNRAELANDLKLDAQEAREWNDGRYILEAYARWGNDTPQHLRGDFAFGIWDAARHRLFCARDRFGTKPFYYAYKPGHFFAFANEIKALWPVPGLDAGVNETQIANYLLSRFEDKTGTFYASVRRLSPASWVEIQPKQSSELRENIYWELNAERELLLPNDEDYAALLCETFTASVRERMRSDGKFAVFLSGGLDSSSVAAVAERYAEPSQKPLPTLSRVFDRFSQCDEREFIQQTLERGDFEPIWRVSDDLTALTDIEKMLWHLDEPSFGPNSCSAWAQYGALQDAGLNVVLDGHGGDEVVFFGYDRVTELLRKGQFLIAWAEIRALRRHQLIDASPILTLWSALLWHASGTRGIGRLLSLWRQRNNSRQTRSSSASRAVGNDAKIEDLSQRLLSPEFAARVQQYSAERVLHTVREQHFNALISGVQPSAMEILDAMAGAHAIEPRYPFWQQRIVEMCLAFPSEQKMRDGFNRYVMRRAMEGLLTPSVQWRTDKTNFAPQIVESLRVVERKKVEELLELWETTSIGVEEYVDLEQVRLLWLNVQNSPANSKETALSSVLIWQILNLGLWLSQHHHTKSYASGTLYEGAVSESQ